MECCLFEGDIYYIDAEGSKLRLIRCMCFNPLMAIVQKSILPLRDLNHAYIHGFQRICSTVFHINIKF